MNVLYTRCTHGNTADSLFNLVHVCCHGQKSLLSPRHVGETSRVTTTPKLMRNGNKHSLSEAATLSTALLTAYKHEVSHDSQ
jgi:hypothetical protein